jgi:predicted DNA-binding transcriptional regulator AlpA
MAGLRIEDVRIMGATEIRQLTGWSRQWTYTVTHRRDFPEPRWKLAAGEFWWADEVEAWLTAYRSQE